MEGEGELDSFVEGEELGGLLVVGGTLGKDPRAVVGGVVEDEDGSSSVSGDCPIGEEKRGVRGRKGKSGFVGCPGEGGKVIAGDEGHASARGEDSVVRGGE